jgi:hypothetical protein
MSCLDSLSTSEPRCARGCTSAVGETSSTQGESERAKTKGSVREGAGGKEQSHMKK